MTGLRRRVSVGFLSIAILLFISGVIAFFELNTLSRDTKSILDINSRKMELAHQMLGLVQSQDLAFVQMTLFDNRAYDSVCLKRIENLHSLFVIAAKETSSPRALDSLVLYTSQMEALTRTIVAMPLNDSLTSSRTQFYDEYIPIHSNIVSSIYDFTTMSFSAMEPRAEHLHRNAYRAVTPVFISLVVMIVIVLLLYYFMIIYCVNPIIRLNRSLSDFIAYRLPFASKDDCTDEVKELQDKIESITIQIRRESNNK